MPNLTQLIYLLASLYNSPDEIKTIVRNAGFNDYLPFIGYHAKATVYWSNIIFFLWDKEYKEDKLNSLIQTVLNDGNQDNEYLKAVLANKDTEFKSPYYKTAVDKPVSVETKQLEKLTQGASTLLPISFLERGIIKSKPVVRIITNKSLGSGFIIQNKYLLTNNHVIGDIETAKSAKIQFNFQESLDGDLMAYVKRELDPLAEKGFETSPEKENDWTIVKLKDYSDEDQKNYGSLELKETSVKTGDYVNIIQHPGGEAKKIALYHNMIVGCDESRIQYLTDTDRGSSGSPVFNTNWEVVALHHAGGEINVRGSNKKELLNEGININLVLKEIRSRGIPI